ncbi:CarD family transcriptional regulator [Fusibacter sp. JL216-2]|uniref:CarD family transcriptional regulator n=1 Tax=Fusibacter sp. JL216-2 TaxID=3071453 RepID=UPI003D32CE2A
MFQIGDKVVYPMHGAGIIEGVEEKEILGETRKYYVLRLPLKNMKVLLPVDNIDQLGLRNIISSDQVTGVFGVLKEDISAMPQNWNRRYRSNMEKVKSGDIYEVADVVRNLMLMDREKGLSTGERKMLTNSKQILVSELCLANDSTEKEILKLIDDALQS